MSEHMLVDIWREMNQHKRQYTWFNGRLDKMARLDMFLISHSMIPLIRYCEIKSIFRSDHAIITIGCDCLQERRGNGLWNFNLALLKETEYIEKIKTVIAKTIYQYAVPVYEEDYVRNHGASVEFTINDTLFLDILLVNIRSETVHYSRTKEKRRRANEKYLLNKIEDIESRLHIASELDKEELKKAKDELEDIRDRKIDGMIIRSRSNWHEKGERSSKYFFNLEKQNWVKKSIPFLRENDKLISGEKNVLGYLTKHFQRIMSGQNEGKVEADIQEFICRNVEKRLTLKQQEKLDEPITEEELSKALYRMQNDRSPGSTGFTAGFFKFFFPDLRAFL